ncbi:hypothetical protein K502DRAFT_339371, partial [Neoconidiobolus thromboides FSU 785]
MISLIIFSAFLLYIKCAINDPLSLDKPDYAKGDYTIKNGPNLLGNKPFPPMLYNEVSNARLNLEVLKLLNDFKLGNSLNLSTLSQLIFLAQSNELSEAAAGPNKYRPLNEYLNAKGNLNENLNSPVLNNAQALSYFPPQPISTPNKILVVNTDQQLISKPTASSNINVGKIVQTTMVSLASDKVNQVSMSVSSHVQSSQHKTNESSSTSRDSKMHSRKESTTKSSFESKSTGKKPSSTSDGVIIPLLNL